MELLSGGQGTIKNVIERFNSQVSEEQGKGLLMLKHLLAAKQIKIDMDKPIDLNHSVNSIEIVDNKGSDTVAKIIG